MDFRLEDGVPAQEVDEGKGRREVFETEKNGDFIDAGSRGDFGEEIGGVVAGKEGVAVPVDFAAFPGGEFLLIFGRIEPGGEGGGGEGGDQGHDDEDGEEAGEENAGLETDVLAEISE